LKNVSNSSLAVTVVSTGAAQIDDSASDVITNPRVARTYRSIGTGYIIL